MGSMQPFDPERYSRQVRFAPLGAAGQARLAAARVAVVGCGALGSVVALTLVRAGVGFLRLIDRDLPEASNLPRQMLFDEADVTAGLPKTVAARQHLERINSAATIEAVVADLTAANCGELLAGVDLIVDGTDNFEARFLVNEFACRQGVPWVHGGAIGAEGRVLAVLPGRTACLRCLIPDPPAAGSLPTCDTAGILGPTALVVGAVESAEAIKLLVGGNDRVGNRLFVCDLWEGIWRTIDLEPLSRQGCPTCRKRDFPWLEGRIAGRAAAICGREAVQVSPSAAGSVDLEVLASRLGAVAAVTGNAWLVRAEVEPGIQLSVFADGRAIVAGTREESRARAIVARYVG
ncbi:MAG: ThiF family adenylyltransferase [Planctomycetia bacterium]|nr:ThiF family adenylyltransferase [Planctomycetia bacterium]